MNVVDGVGGYSTEGGGSVTKEKTPREIIYVYIFIQIIYTNYSSDELHYVCCSISNKHTHTHTQDNRAIYFNSLYDFFFHIYLYKCEKLI